MKMLFVRNFLFVILCINSTQPALAEFDTRTLSTTPKEIYGKNQSNVKVRIGNGPAGSTGILRTLSEDYLLATRAPYSIAWYQDITSNTVKQLKKGTIDIALVCEKNQVDPSQKEEWADSYAPIFNDHFLIVGPKSNPAKLDRSDSTKDAFLKIASLGRQKPDMIFLSRDDNSSANLKERLFWSVNNLKPWEDNSPWYYKYRAFPQEALLRAEENSLYLVTNWGTWISNKSNVKNLEIFLQGGKTLLNPCYALLESEPNPEAQAFFSYLRSERAQKIIANFGKDRYGGLALFTPAWQIDF